MVKEKQFLQCVQDFKNPTCGLPQCATIKEMQMLDKMIKESVLLHHRMCDVSFCVKLELVEINGVL